MVAPGRPHGPRGRARVPAHLWGHSDATLASTRARTHARAPRPVRASTAGHVQVADGAQLRPGAREPDFPSRLNLQRDLLEQVRPLPHSEGRPVNGSEEAAAVLCIAQAEHDSIQPIWHLHSPLDFPSVSLLPVRNDQRVQEDVGVDHARAHTARVVLSPPKVQAARLSAPALARVDHVARRGAHRDVVCLERDPEGLREGAVGRSLGHRSDVLQRRLRHAHVAQGGQVRPGTDDLKHVLHEDVDAALLKLVGVEVHDPEWNAVDSSTVVASILRITQTQRRTVRSARQPELPPLPPVVQPMAVWNAESVQERIIIHLPRPDPVDVPNRPAVLPTARPGAKRVTVVDCEALGSSKAFRLEGHGEAWERPHRQERRTHVRGGLVVVREQALAAQELHERGLDPHRLRHGTAQPADSNILALTDCEGPKRSAAGKLHFHHRCGPTPGPDTSWARMA
mmetsp:Transcript_48479/g.149952  ORF Transcript_48479/g.149952 Transcript_48479/m.149952 type:complete len:454 (+) Transcript_48479:126-1487(+)